MKSLFESETALNILQRIEKLQPNSQPNWGKMNVAQMLAHVNAALQTALTNEPYKTTLFQKILAPVIKKVVLSPKPYKENLPTGPGFVMIHTEKEFDKEKRDLLTSYHKFIDNGSAGVDNKKHPVFGKLTAEQWGFSQWKHFDHHLKQFGV
jgi:Protein of unknown function (DUF1569)